MVGDAVFCEACGDGGIDVLLGCAFGMEAEWGVGVVVGAHYWSLEF